MEELLQQKNYYCKPNSGLKMNCKLISGLINKNCKLFLGRYIRLPPHQYIYYLPTLKYKTNTSLPIPLIG